MEEQATPRSTRLGLQITYRLGKRFAYFGEFENRLQSLQANVDVIEAYYTGDWLDDVEKWCKSQRKEFHPCIEEDYIWNVFDDFYLEKKRSF